MNIRHYKLNRLLPVMVRLNKNQVIYMTMNILGIREKIKPDDTADALAVAICTAHSSHTDRLKRLV